MIQHRFRRLYPYLWRHRRALVLGILSLLGTAYLEIRVAVLIGNGIDLLGLELGALTELKRSLLSWFLVLTLGLGVGVAVTRFWMRWLIIGASRHIEYEFRNDFFHHLLGLSAGFYDRHRTGDIMSRATSDMEAIRIVIGPAIMYLANTAAVLPLAAYQMLRISPLLTLVIWLPLLTIAPLFYFFKTHIHRRFRLVQELMGELTTNVQETLAGIRVVKIYAREGDRAAGFDRVSDQYVAANIRLARLQAIFIPLLMLVVGLAVLMLIWVGSWLIIHGRLRIGELTSFFLLLNWSVWPLIALGWVLTQIERGSASMARVEEILKQQPEIPPAVQGEGVQAGVEVAGRIEVRDLWFSYPRASEPALRGLTLTIPAGSTMGLTGPVGCGKSTLARLLARRYNPPAGAILIDGRDILEWPVAGLRGRIGIVDQEPFLFSDSIAANILFGIDGEGASGAVERARQAAQAAQLHEDVQNFAGQYETLLGERGINLSGGQRQRAALARALARDPALLILDDALAAVDTHTEEAILSALRELLVDRTSLIISHRISTVSLADRVAYMEEGRIVEQGTHQELLARRGRYYELAQRQRLAEEIEQAE